MIPSLGIEVYHSLSRDAAAQKWGSEKSEESEKNEKTGKVRKDRN